MSRPTDWSPLAASDPVPGRPSDIADEAVRLGRVADSIRDQVQALHRVAAKDESKELSGQFVGKISKTAKSLADSLGKAEGRYRVATGELKQWAAALEQAQADSVTQLGNAQTAQQAIAIHTPAPAPPGTTAAPVAPTAADQQALSTAQNQLADAHAALAKIVSALHAEGQTRAKNIDAADSRDGLHDSWWDRRKNTIDHCATAISNVCNGLGWFATALAVVALFIPGANVIVLLALGATALSLLGHTALAAAGDGSWFDVGLDVFAIATFGAGRVAGKSMEAARDTLRGTMKGSAATRAGIKAAQAAVEKNPAAVNAYKIVDAASASGSEKAAAWVSLRPVTQDAAAAAAAARQTTTKLADPAVKKYATKEFVVPSLKVVQHGDHTAAALRVWAAKVAVDAGHDERVMADVKKLNDSLKHMRWAFGLGAGADTTDKIFGSTLPYFNMDPGYSPGTRNPFTMPIGATW